MTKLCSIYKPHDCKMQLLVIAVVCYTLLSVGECQKARAPTQLSMVAAHVVTTP